MQAQERMEVILQETSQCSEELSAAQQRLNEVRQIRESLEASARAQHVKVERLYQSVFIKN